LWKSDVTHYYLLSLPGVVVAMFLGQPINRRMNTTAVLVA
jgi:hypothetical protein